MLALLFGVLQTMVLDLQGQICTVARLLASSHDLDVGANRACNSSAKQIQDHLSEHQVTCADCRRCSLVNIHGQCNVSLFEVIFSYTLNLF